MKNSNFLTRSSANSLQILGGGSSQNSINHPFSTKALRFCAMLLLLCLGVGQMWAYISFTVGVTGTGSSSSYGGSDYNKMYLNVKWQWDGTDKGWSNPKPEMTRAGVTFEGKDLWITFAEFNDAAQTSNVEFQKYKNDYQVYSWDAYAGKKSGDYWNSYIVEYGGSRYGQISTSSGAKFYFDASNWSQSTLKFVIGHTYYQYYYAMTNITGTKLYYMTASNYSGAMGIGVVGGTNRENEGHTEQLTNVSANASEYSGWKNYGLTSTGASDAYLMVNNGNAGEEPTMYYFSDYTTLDGSSTLQFNNTQTFYTVVKEAGGSYSSANSKATIDISSYELTGQGSTTARASSISTSASSATITACRTANTRLQVGTPATGYQFDGWWPGATTGSNKSYLSDYTYNPTEATTLYARFSAKNYTITLDRKGGTGDNQQVTATYNSSSLSDAVTAPEKSGYTFAGWYTNNGGATGAGDLVINTSGELVGSVAGYTDGSANWIHDGDVTLYARWKDNNHVGKYNFQYGSGPRYGSGWTIESFVYKAGNEYNITNFTMPDPDDTPKFFVGHNGDFISSGLGTGSSKSVETNITDLKLVTSLTSIGDATGAVGTLQMWQNNNANNLGVRFIPNGFGLTYDSGTLPFSAADANNMRQTETVTLIASDVSSTFKVGLATATANTYVDCGRTAEDDDNDLNTRAGALEDSGYPEIPDLAADLKGRFVMWENNSGTDNNWNLVFLPVYTVSYDGNGSDGGSTPAADTEYLHNENVTVLDNTFTKTHYEFSGWNTADDGSGISYDADDVIENIDSDITLYAQWEEIEHTVSASVAEGGGGTVGAASYTAYGVTPTAITATPATGYKFKVWRETGGTSYVTFADSTSASTTITATGDASIEAVFDYRWSIAGQWLTLPGVGEWDTETNLMTSITDDGGDYFCSATITLDANTTYTFKVVDRASAPYSWYGLAALSAITYTTDDLPWALGTGGEYKADCSITTAGAGSYTFTWNIKNKEVSVEFPTSWEVTMAMDPASGAGTVTPASGYMSEENGATITAIPYFGYDFTGWTVSDEAGSFGNAEDSCTTFTPSADATVTANFARRYAFINGKFQVYDSDRKTRTMVGTAGGAGDYNSRSIPMTYDETNHRFYYHTYSTPDELKEISSGDGAYFLIQTSTSHSSWVNRKQYGAIDWKDDGINALSASGTQLATILNNRSFIFTGTEDGYVIIYFDGEYVWYELESALSYDANGGTGSAPASRSYYTYGSSQIVATNSFTRASASFTGWNTADDGDGTGYAAGATVTMNAAEIVLYAQWVSSNFVIYRTGDMEDDPRHLEGDVETYAGGTIDKPIEFRMKVSHLDQWYSLSLPFAVNAVKVWDEEDGEYYDLVPYYRSDGIFYTGHYVIRTPELTNDSLALANFSAWNDPSSPTGYRPSMNTPYIVQWHHGYFQDRYVSFFGAASQTIPSSMTEGKRPKTKNWVTVYGNDAMVEGSVEDAYTLNGDEIWERPVDKGKSVTIQPFECYIRANAETTNKYLILRRGMTFEDEATHFETIDVASPVNAKVLIDGQIYILREGKMYTLQGILVQ